MIEIYLARWHLTRDGAPILTDSSEILPVRCADGTAAMLKIARIDEEQRGNALMAWWHGQGAARIFAHDGAALLLERGAARPSLAAMALSGSDEAAARILCAVAARLHAPRPEPPPELVPLEAWFASLEPAAVRLGGRLTLAAEAARHRLADQADRRPLHGDLHHGNVLCFADGDWRAIDPKGLCGDRAFDFVNLLRNPDRRLTAAPGRLGRLASLVSTDAGLNRSHLLEWTVAFAGLSAAWNAEEGKDPAADLEILQIAAAELAR